ncbi:MAG: ATP-dependent DNA helicase RecG [Candidatus Moranbacteria bacterium]|nr:ATP-dependent DNA helicase RecG [Candidatus Moranbacteria bacterium]
MVKITLNTSIAALKGIGYRYREALEKKGIEKVKDLLFYFPFRYDDFSQIKLIGELQAGGKVTVEAKIGRVEKKITFRRRMKLTEALVSDKTGSMKIIWFNQPFIAQSLRKGEIYRFSGKVDFNSGFLALHNPSFEKMAGPSVNTAGLLPVYHEDYLLTSRWLRRQIHPLLPLTKKIPETLPELLLKNYGLLPLPKAAREIHFPASPKIKDAARRRLAFEELFLIQLYLGIRKLKWKKHLAYSVIPDINLTKKFASCLPFKLTLAQRRSAWEILQDLGKSYPMNRLLEGDVGSGKTLVAAIAALNVAKRGLQAVILAPTEILAFQHFKTLKQELQDFLPLGSVGVFTRSQRRTGGKKLSKNEFLLKVKSNQVKIICATHAVLQEEVKFPELALVVIDEQHRFGVSQRSHLQRKLSRLGKNVPHLLSMSATPIPRTLALAIYSDLELSILNELPKGRRKIITRIVAPANRKLMYQFIRQEIKKGRQAFVICPLIEDKLNVNGEKALFGEASFAPGGELFQPRSSPTKQQEIRAVKKEQKVLSEKIFPDLKVALLHGRMKGKEKERIMLDFKDKKFHILVATSVVEVGVDIQNATVMLVEGAERFGLAQLHQFRGRVGRGEHQSYCFLALSEGGINANRRLKALQKCEDGFRLAEQDLKIRGPGEFFGERQSGLPDLTMANLNDSEIIKTARAAAALILAKSPDLSEYPVLKTRLELFKKGFHGE